MSPQDLFVRVLGPLEAVRGGTTVEIAGARQRALLAALAVRAGRPVSVAELVDAVWSDDPPPRARSTLQTYVSRLRRQLGDAAIEHGPAGYRLGTGVRTDLAEARALVSRLTRDDSGAVDDRAAAGLVALERWNGGALTELSDVDWFRAALVELAELRRRLLELTAGALVEAGRADEAAALLEVELAEDPLREPMQVLLVRSLHAAGRSNEALRAANRYRRALRDETGLLPGPAFEQIERQVLEQEPAPAPAAPRTNRRGTRHQWTSASLSRRTNIVGRHRDLVRLAELTASSRLVTVVGTGGVGKTRLLAEHLHHPAEHERLVVELAPVARGDVASAVGAALGVHSGAIEPSTIAELLDTGAGEHLVVLVLDNCEHVVSEVRALVRAVLDQCPRARVLATSRTRLGLADETVLTLAPLATSGVEPPARELFRDRLRRADPGRAAELDDATVDRVCERLDGVPLALELAAGRVAALGTALLERGGGVPVEVLVDAGGDGRHSSLERLVDWSIDLLEPPAQVLLQALSTFQGPFNLVAAEAVGASVVDESVPLLLSRLVDASLVSASEQPGTYRLLELIRQVSAQRFATHPRTGAAHTAHGRWVATAVADVEATSVGPAEHATVGALDALRHEVLAALERAGEGADVEAAAAVAVPLAGTMLYRPDAGLLGALRHVVTRLDAAGAADPALLSAGARAAFLLGDLEAVEPLARRALEAEDGSQPLSVHRATHALAVSDLYRGRFPSAAERFAVALGDQRARATERLDALGGLALAHCYGGRHQDAGEVAQEHRAMAETLDSETYLAFADLVDGERAMSRGDVDVATTALLSATDRAWRVGASFIWGLAATVLAAVLVRHQPPPVAARHLVELISGWRRSATWPQLWTAMRLVAELLHRTGRPDVAALVLARAAADRAAPALVGVDERRMSELRDSFEQQLGAPALAGIASAARDLPRAAVVERAVAALAAIS